MATVSRGLPQRPHLDIPKREARELLNAWRAAQPEALDRIRWRRPKFQSAGNAAIQAALFRLRDAPLGLAREYGFTYWMELKERINTNSVAGALRAAQKGFDVLVSDIGLPDGTGRDLVRQLVSQRQVPAIALTGYGTDDDIRSNAEAGFTHHLTKPVDAERLLGVIAELAQRKPGRRTA